ncbi:hypothetical protein N7540_003757 [Penicillium herquei]|nr:hypothetical protein N7540_003757 [Penicillium herquei]
MPLPSHCLLQKNLRQGLPDAEYALISCPRLIGDNVNHLDTDEARLEQSGDINALQRFRLAEHYRGIPNDDPQISHRLYFFEEDLRELVQEEIAIKLHILNKNTKERLEVLNKKYWFLEQKWRHYYSCLRDGYQRNAFDLWRSHPKWYMHQTLMEECAPETVDVPVDVGAVIFVSLPLYGSLELGIVLLNATVVVKLEALKFLKKTRIC